MKLNETRINAKTIEERIPYGDKSVISSFTTYLDTEGKMHVDISDGYPANAIPKIWSRDPKSAPSCIESYTKDDGGHVIGVTLKEPKEGLANYVISRCHAFQTAMNEVKADYEKETGEELGAMDAPEYMRPDFKFSRNVQNRDCAEIKQMVSVLKEQFKHMQERETEDLVR